MVRYPPECGGEEEEEGWIGNSDCGCNISLISIERGLCVISAGMWSSIVSFSQHRPSVCRHGAIKFYFVRWLNLFIISKRHAEETCPGYWFLRIVVRPLVEKTDWAAGLAGTIVHAFSFLESWVYDQVFSRTLQRPFNSAQAVQSFRILLFVWLWKTEIIHENTSTFKRYSCILIVALAKPEEGCVSH